MLFYYKMKKSGVRPFDNLNITVTTKQYNIQTYAHTSTMYSKYNTCLHRPQIKVECFLECLVFSAYSMQMKQSNQRCR
uniref:Uncharacterized protein n=1 Tax=Anguilla anguilla TaxID=7936 RepID=A0A0E9X3Y7_ANGAN